MTFLYCSLIQLCESNLFVYFLFERETNIAIVIVGRAITTDRAIKEKQKIKLSKLKAMTILGAIEKCLILR